MNPSMLPVNNALTRLIDAMHDEILQASSPTGELFDTWMKLKARIEPAAPSTPVTLEEIGKNALRILVPSEALKMAEQWKGRADDAGRLSRAVIGASTDGEGA